MQRNGIGRHDDAFLPLDGVCIHVLLMQPRNRRKLCIKKTPKKTQSLLLVLLIVFGSVQLQLLFTKLEPHATGSLPVLPRPDSAPIREIKNEKTEEEEEEEESFDYSKWFLADGRPRYTRPQQDDGDDNYFWLAASGYFGNASQDLVPFKILLDYQKKHGRERLEQEWKSCRKQKPPHPNGTLARIQSCPDCSACRKLAKRTFVVGRYSCPLEAGNRLHKYMNHLLWAIVTGRTFLSGYWDYASCLEEMDEVDRCDKGINTKEDCHAVLRPNHQDKDKGWVPQWDDWKDILGLPPPVRVDGINPKGYDALGRPYDQDDSGNDNNQTTTPRVMRVGQQLLLTPGMYLGFPPARSKLLGKPANRQLARRLTSLGHYFLYGMLWESLFTLQPQTTHPDPSLVADPTVYQTWVLHSRHPTKEADGAYIEPERVCLERLAPHMRPPCVVYLMSDRETSLGILEEELKKTLVTSSSNNNNNNNNNKNQSFYCVGIVANHQRGSSAVSAEHGAFAGVGYFQDLALVRHARHGFIAPHLQKRVGKGIRTSSGLVRNLMEFRRQLENYARSNHNNSTAMTVTEEDNVYECTHPFQLRDKSSHLHLP